VPDATKTVMSEKIAMYQKRINEIQAIIDKEERDLLSKSSNAKSDEVFQLLNETMARNKLNETSRSYQSRVLYLR
jgi:hypothetical protein